MATVFLARDTRQDRPVALKVLHSDLATAVGPERFRREIEIATRLSHPHILSLYDSGEADGQLYYVMPFVEGPSLRERLDRERQLAVGEALRITLEVASALDYAHRQGVVHRDVKPENVLLESGRAVVADFGVARALSESSARAPITQTGVTLGTPLYMSPEQAFGDRVVDGRSDEYALACVLYEMLAGQPPFSGPTAQAIMARHSFDAVPSLRVVRSTVPDQVEDVVMRALSKAPADRFATVGQFADALRNCDMSATGARGVERRLAPRGATPPARRWRTAALLAPALLLAAGLAAWPLWRRPQGDAAYGARGFDPRRVAVLYFHDLSPDRSLGFAADGLTEALIDQLGQVRALDVVSRNGVMTVRGADPPLDSVARVFAAGTIVTGSVERVGEKLRVGVRMRDGNSGVDVHRRSFEQPTTNVLQVRDELAQSVAEFLRKRLGEEVRLRALRGGTKSVPAWSLLQRAGRVKRDADASALRDSAAVAARDYARADTLLAQAEALDPRWSEPSALRAELAYARARLDRRPLAAKPWIEQGLVHAERALQLEPRSAGALAARGTLRYWRFLQGLVPDRREGDALIDSAEADLRAAVTMEPSRAAAWSFLSHLYYYKRDDKIGSRLAAQRAYEEDAYLSAADGILWRLFATSYDLGQFPDATRWCEEGARRFPENHRFVECQLWNLSTPSTGPDPARAWQLLTELRRLTPKRDSVYEDHLGRMAVAAVLARAGAAESARRLMVAARADPDVDPPRELVKFEAFARTLLDTPGDRNEAIRLLKLYLSAHRAHHAADEHNEHWWWNSLRDDPRYVEITGGRAEAGG